MTEPNYSQYLYFYSQSVWIFVFLIVLLINWKARRHLIMGGLLFIPAAFLGPVYSKVWIPLRMFDFFIGIEDILFCFLSGGIAIGIVFPLMRNQKENKYKIRLKRLIITLLTSLLLILVLYAIGFRHYQNTILAAILIIGLIVLSNPKLFFVFIWGALLTSICYSIGLSVGFNIWPDLFFLWDHNNLLGIYLFGFPIEEIAWAFLLGGTWPMIYFYIFDISIKSDKLRGRLFSIVRDQ